MRGHSLPIVSLLVLAASCGARSPIYEIAPLDSGPHDAAPPVDAGADLGIEAADEASFDAPVEAFIDAVAEALVDAPDDAAPSPGHRLWTGGASASHSCAIRGGGSLYCWGNNFDGQLGDGSTKSSAVPLAIAVEEATQVSLGGSHSVAIGKWNGTFRWGDNSQGQLGIGDAQGLLTPGGMPAPVVRFIVAGGHHTCAVDYYSGAVACGGSNDAGQLAIEPIGGNQTTFTIEFSNAVDKVTAPVAAGHRHTCAIAQKRLWCWGDNAYGQLGLGHLVTQASPAAVDLPDAPTQVVAGMRHTCALLDDGGVWCWGEGGYGQLGNASFEDSTVPLPVHIPASEILQIVAGGAHSCLRTAAGDVHCWGLNGSGQLGNGSFQNSAAPIPVGMLDAVDLAAGGEHTCAARANGPILCWGSNGQGQLGNGTTGGDHPAPAAVTGLP